MKQKDRQDPLPSNLATTAPTTLEGLREKYAARQALAAGRRAYVDEADVLAELMADLDAANEAHLSEMLDFERASHVAQLGRRQLARLAASGEVKSRGSNRNRQFERRSLLERRRSVERKPLTAALPDNAVAHRGTAEYDPRADARRVARLLNSSNNQEEDR